MSSIRAREQTLRRQIRKWSEGAFTFHKCRRTTQFVGGTYLIRDLELNGVVGINATLEEAEHACAEFLGTDANYAKYLTTNEHPKPFAEWLDEQEEQNRN